MGGIDTAKVKMLLMMQMLQSSQNIVSCIMSGRGNKSAVLTRGTTHLAGTFLHMISYRKPNDT